MYGANLFYLGKIYIMKRPTPYQQLMAEHAQLWQEYSQLLENHRKLQLQHEQLLSQKPPKKKAKRTVINVSHQQLYYLDSNVILSDCSSLTE